jgi:hypothetical protein
MTDAGAAEPAVVAAAGETAVVAVAEGTGGGADDVVVGGGEDMIAAELADTKLVEPTALPDLGRSL